MLKHETVCECDVCNAREVSGDRLPVGGWVTLWVGGRPRLPATVVAEHALVWTRAPGGRWTAVHRAARPGKVRGLRYETADGWALTSVRIGLDELLAGGIHIDLSSVVELSEAVRWMPALQPGIEFSVVLRGPDDGRLPPSVRLAVEELPDALPMAVSPGAALLCPDCAAKLVLRVGASAVPLRREMMRREMVGDDVGDVPAFRVPSWRA